MARRLSLTPHPDTPSGKVTAVEVELIAGSGDDLLISYFVTGAEHLIVPERRMAARRDGLWETTCFEAFLKPVGGEAYFEFNFSPSTEWAAYRFERHREGRSDLARPVDPFSTRGKEPSDPLLEVDLDLSGLPDVAMRLGLSAVIEEKGGRKSYWALAHPPGDPDFHNASCFTLELPAARI
ncbi:MAG TPA: DOMON-like domain-containing protein [Allosphingosinicella sp.]|jgi:hypothetical protein